MSGFRIFELLEIIGSSADTLALILDAFVEGRGNHFGVVNFCLQCEFLKKLGISLDGTGLLKSVQELLPGLLLGVQVGPLELEVLLELPPVQEVFRSEDVGGCKF